jgi:hypothetical protein
MPKNIVQQLRHRTAALAGTSWGRTSAPLRLAVLGAVLFGIAGGIAGLVIGLLAYAPTAWFAVFELGVPAALAGCLAGFLLGMVWMLVRRFARPGFRLG